MAYKKSNPNGQATMANSEPVVIASNQTSIPVTQSGTWDEVGINDSGNSITVDNGGTFAVQVDGAALTSLQLIDDTVTTLGTDTYTEATSKGLTIGAVRRDADTTLVNTTNEFGPLQMDANGRLKVEAFSGETLPVSLTSTTVTGTVAVTQSGTWDEVGINDSGNSITVDNGGTFAVQVDGSALTSLQLIDDTVFTDDTSTHATGTTKGQGIMAVANPTDSAVDANDIGMVAMTLARALKNDITTIAGTAPTTAGFIDIKGADGNVFVRQATASNLNMTEASAASILTSVQLIDDVVYTDDTSTHSTGSSKGMLIMAAATPTDTSVNANDIGAVAMTTDRRLLVDASGVAVPITDNSSSISVDWNGTQPVTGSGTATGALRVELANNGTGLVGLNAGTNAIGKLAANSGVDIGDVDVTTVGTITPGTAASSLGKAEDAQHNSGDVGVASWSVANEAQTSLAADGDYIARAADVKGNSLMVGNLAHDAVDAGFPVKTGGQARQTNPTAVADADRVNFIADDLGRQVVVTGQVRDLVTQSVTTITSSTSETTILSAGAAGVFHDLKAVMIANKSASATLVTIRDATAGSAVAYIHCPAGDTRGVVFTTPFKQTTAANNWTAQCGTSVDSVYITVQAEKNV